MDASKAQKKLASGSLWITISEVINGIAALATSVIAARVLAPEDFGHMGIVFLTIGILEAFSQTGFERALVQRQKDVESFLNVAWTWHLGRGAFMALIMLGISPWLADWYGESVLAPVLATCALYLFFEGAKNIGVIFFSRQLDFKAIFIINSVRALLKFGVAIPAIFIFKNVWALVIEFVLGALIGLIVSYVAHPYRPRLEWNWHKAKQLIRFGKWITALTIISFFITKGDDLFISKYLGAVALGLYYFAYEISNWPATKISHILSRVSFPTYSRLQDDREKLREAFVNVMKTTMYLTGPASALIWFLIPHFVENIIGSKWEAIIPLVRILVIAGFVRSFQALAGALFQASNRPDLDFKMNLPRFLSMAVLLWPFTAAWGLEGASLVIVVAICVTLPIWFFGVKHIIGLGFIEVLRINSLAFLSTAILTLCLLVVTTWTSTNWIGFAMTIVASLGLWLGILWLIGKFTSWNVFAEIQRFRTAFQK